jgi:branched-subunit amino acid aminotransferase/4-amino-4-deoxychorismate lyase
MRAYDGEPYLLDRHLERMRRSADDHGVDVRYGNATIERGIRSLLGALGLKSAHVRLVQTGGGTFLIRAMKHDPLPAAWYRLGAAVDYAPWRRDPRAPLFGHKTLNYLENVETLLGARGIGLADMLFLSVDGHVLEGCVTNVFMVSRGHLATPNLKGILPGVTRSEVIRLAKSLRIPVDECRLLRRHFERADEVFLTNALIEVLPVSRVGTRRIGPPGPVTRSLMAGYRRLAVSSGQG